MGEAYPELGARRGDDRRDRPTSKRTASSRRSVAACRFSDEATADLGEGDMLEGVTAFKLYDTYGFPLDLTQDALRTRGITVDRRASMPPWPRQKAEARKSWAGSGEAADDQVWFAVADKVGPTEFLGYETETAEGEIVALVKGGQMVDVLTDRRRGLCSSSTRRHSTARAAARSATAAGSPATASRQRASKPANITASSVTR